jgi:hypothetical protein
MEPDSRFVFYCFVVMIIEVLFLYSQTVFGARWFLPEKFQKQSYNPYRSKEEVKLVRPDAENVI